MRAVLLGGSGLVGRAVARRLLGSGWTVQLVGRDPARVPADLTAAGVGFTRADRAELPALRAVVGDRTDLLVDCVCFTAAQASELVALAAGVPSTVLISSKAVYVDGAGRHSNSPEPPQFAGPVTERQATLPAALDGEYRSAGGYGPNKVAAERVVLDSGLPVTVLRPSKIHGEGARPPREWYFVRRVLDRRPVVLLARHGAGVDHPSAAVNIAALVEVVAAHPGARVLNIADPDAPDGRQIARTVAPHLAHDWREVLLDEHADPALGAHPWNRRHPVVLDTGAARALGYLPVGDYAGTVAAELDWLVGLAELPPEVVGGYLAGHLGAGAFDYAAEDRYLAGLSPA